MQRHVNDWPGTMKVATGFLKTLLNFKQSALDNKLLAEVIEESEDILKVYEAAKPKQPQTLVQELASVLNRRSLENGSNTPDFILADYLSRCLVLFDDATKARANWYGQPMKDLEFNKVVQQGPKPREFKSPFQGVLDAAEHFHKATAQQFTGMDLNDAKQAIDEYYKTRSHWEADALIKRQFPCGGMVGNIRSGCAQNFEGEADFESRKQTHQGATDAIAAKYEAMRKEAAHKIMADVEIKTAETLQGYKQSIGYMQGPLWEEFKQTNAELAKMWDDGQRTTQEYKDLQKKANELAAEIGKVKKEAIEKEGADKMARMVADVMSVADGFVVAAKAIQVFNKEAKEAEETRKRFEHMAKATENGQNPHAGKKPITDKTGFLFISKSGTVLWAFHDGCGYFLCHWEGSAWVGCKASEADVIEAGNTQLPLFLDHFIRSVCPTQ